MPSLPRAACRALAVLLAGLVLAAVPGGAQPVLDRVVARVNGALVFLSDVRAGVAVGLVEAGSEADEVRQLVERQLLLGEVARFPPAEPTSSDVAAEVARMQARVGDLSAFYRTHGLTDGYLPLLARDSLRIRAYLAQRFGQNPPVSDDVALEYYREHPDEFSKGGVRQSFQEVQALARERAGADRRQAAVTQWVRELESRAEVVRPQPPAP